MFFNPSLTPPPLSMNRLVLSTQYWFSHSLKYRHSAGQSWTCEASPLLALLGLESTAGDQPLEAVGRPHGEMCLETVHFRRSSIKQWLWSVTSPPTEGLTGPQAHQAPSSLSILKGNNYQPPHVQGRHWFLLFVSCVVCPCFSALSIYLQKHWLCIL